MPLDNSKYELHKTLDGSKTFYIPDMDEFFHSPKGALSESIHVFIEAGLRHLVNSRSLKQISILEIGFGTGLNALLTLVESIDHDLDIYYESLDKYPLTFNELNEIDHKSLLDDSYHNNMDDILNAEWNKEIKINDDFTIQKKEIDLLNYSSTNNFDLIYYDAFAPSKQSELWTQEALQKVKNVSNNNSILVTYCAQGQFKRNLKALDYKVESLKGANHKREMVRATSIKK